MNSTESTKQQSELFNREEAASYIRVSVASLAAWATANRYGLPMVKVGRLVRYRKSDLDRWLDSRTQHTAEAK